MYQSGQFLHYLALREDWFDENHGYNDLKEQIKPMSSLNVIGSVVYQIAEIFEFLSRLANSGIYEEGVRASISLNNTLNRQLWISDPMRAPFLESYKTAAFKIESVNELSMDKAVGNSKQLAMEAMLQILDHFGWHNPPIETLKKDQENFLTGKM
jgi:hypothetical protein